MSELMDGGKCVSVKGSTWTGIACGVKGELSGNDLLELEKFAQFLKSKSKKKHTGQSGRS